MAIGLINRSAPSSSANAVESLDAALAMASFDADVRLFFSDDGVYQLLNGQQPKLAGARDSSKTLGVLDLYDIEQVLVLAPSLTARGLKGDDLRIPVSVLSLSEWQTALADCQQLLSF